MGSNITDEDIIKHKKSAIKQLNNTFETFINSPNAKHKKKADLIAYWIENYSKYLLSEEKFDYGSIPKYKRGEVISVNFGFNVGSEHGGLHYALVLDNDNKKIKEIEQGNRVTHQALLALLESNLNGNNVEEMQRAKKALTDYLINKR